MLLLHSALVALRVVLLLKCIGVASAQSSTSSYWVNNIPRQGTVPFTSNGGTYEVYRNVQDFGAKGTDIDIHLFESMSELV